MPLQIAEGAEPVAGYRLVKLLGRGGFGEVWEAEAPGGHRVALKFIRTDTGQSDPELRALKAIMEVRHPHLLDTHFSQQVEDYLVIATSLCDKNLMDRFREYASQGEPGIPVDRLLRYMEETAIALDFLNEHTDESGQTISIQHRDIKPHNIFLVGDSVKVADFGLAKALENSVASHTGSMTPHYAPPEMFKRAVAKTSDQYSLAISYCQLRTGKLPFTGSSHEVLYAHLNEPPDLSELSSGERPIVNRALAKEPTERWPSCGDFVAALKQACLVESPVQSKLELDRGGTGATLQPDSSVKPAAETKGTLQAEQATQESTTQRSAVFGSRKKLGIVAGFAGILALAAAVVVYFQTDYGTIKITLQDPKAVELVRIDGKQIEVSALDKPLRFRARQDHLLEVSGDGFKSVSKTFTVKRGDNPAVEVEFIPTPEVKPKSTEVAKKSSPEPPNKPNPNPPPTPLPAVFTVTVDPEDAEVEVEDGNGELSGSGPRRTLKVVGTDGKRKLKLIAKRDGYQSVERELTPAEGQTANLSMTLEPLPAVYNLAVNPMNVLVTVDGVIAKISGSGEERRITIVRPDETSTAVITATLSGYESAVERVVPKRGTNERLTLSLKPMPAVLELTLMPDNATVTTSPSDVKIQTTGPKRLLTVDRPDVTNSVTVAAALNGYTPGSIVWTPSPGGMERQTLTLVPKPAVLTLTLDPPAAEVQVTPPSVKLTGTGAQREATVARFDQTNKVVITASLKGYMPGSYEWSPTPGLSERFTFVLKPAPPTSQKNPSQAPRQSSQRPSQQAMQQSASKPPLAVAPFDAKKAKQLQQQWAAYLKTKPVIENSIGMKLALIPPGEYMMGSKLSFAEIAKRFEITPEHAEKYFADEHPRHRVRITKPYFVGVQEVTVGQFREFVNDDGYRTEPEKDGEGGYGYNATENKFEGRDPKYNWIHTGFSQEDNHPVVNVTWNDAEAFVKWLSHKSGDKYRLLTEAEWEYACRAGAETLFHSGDADSDLIRGGNVADQTVKEKFSDWTITPGRDGYVFTAPVGKFAPNAFGLYDTHGNVYEWCTDWYAEDYYKQSPPDDPSGPSSEQEYRVLRGGSWRFLGRYCRSASRLRNAPGGRSNNLGFRVARDLSLPQTTSATSTQSSHDLATQSRSTLTGTRAGEEWSDNTLKMKFCWCPPGEFTMGSPPSEPDRDDDENQVDVTLSKGFWLGKYEVTQTEYQKVMGNNPSWFSADGGGKDMVTGMDTANFPVEQASWEDAMEFCRKLTEQERRADKLPKGWKYSLPTEAQWEYACRAGTATATAFGESLSSAQANFRGNLPYNGAAKGPYLEKTCKVGSYKANAWALFDMHGNVYEWCRDWDVDGLRGGRDPEVTSEQKKRVLRGGSWICYGWFCRSADRYSVTPGDQVHDIGFRVALVPE